MVIVRLILSENLGQLRRALIGDVELERRGMGNVRPSPDFYDLKSVWLKTRPAARRGHAFDRLAKAP